MLARSEAEDELPANAVKLGRPIVSELVICGPRRLLSTRKNESGKAPFTQIAGAKNREGLRGVIRRRHKIIKRFTITVPVGDSQNSWITIPIQNIG